MKRASITELARADLDKIWDYVARRNLPAADRLIDQMIGQCQRLASAPHLGRDRSHFTPGLWSCRVKSYFIFYFVTDDGIEVARVLHGARDLPKIF